MPSKYVMETAEANRQTQLKGGRSGMENPDRVIQRRGMEYIEDIERDTHLSSVINTRIQSVLSKGWNIIPHSSGGKITARDQTICDFVKYCLESIPTFETDIIAMFDSIGKGFSLSEKNYNLIRKGKWKGKLGLKNIRFKPAKNFSFEFDKFGNYTLKQIDPFEKTLDLDKFIHFISGRDDENPWGESASSKASFWVWIKKNIAKFWAIHGERFGMPFVDVAIPSNLTPGTPEYTKAEEFLSAVLKDSGGLRPENFEVKFLEAMRTGDANYGAYINVCNKEISKVVLGQTLSVEEGSKGQGSYALGSVHAGVLNNYTLFDVLISAAILNNQLIKQLVDFNFITESYPKFEWNVFDVGTVTVLAQNISNLASMLDIPAEWLYNKMGIPIPGKNDKILKIPTPKNGSQQPISKDVDNRAIENAEHNDDIECFIDDSMKEELEKLMQQNIIFLQENDDIILNLEGQLAEAYLNIKNEIAAMKKFKPAKIDKLFEKHVQPVVFKVLMLGELQGRYHGKISVGQMEAFSQKFAENDPSEKLIEAFLKNNLLSREDFDRLEQELKRQSFTIAGTESTELLAKVRDKMSKVLETGGGWPDFISQIDDVFYKQGISALNKYHLEVVVRTNLQTLYSRGREEVYKHVDREQFPYKTVLAILDDRVRADHAKLHGFTAPIDDPVWQKLKTPFDYNCRCVIIAVHKNKNFKVSGKIPDLSNLKFVNNLS